MARIVSWAREDSGHAYLRIPLPQVQTGGRREALAADWRLRVADITQVLIPGDVTRSAGRPANAVLLNLIRQGRVLIGAIALMVLAGIIKPEFLAPRNISNVLRQSAALGTALLALYYLRRYRLERPAIGVFNRRDIMTLFGFLTFLPFLYVILPRWGLTAFLVLTFVVVLFNFLADILYFRLDPRITE